MERIGGGNMINNQEFYADDDNPSSKQKKQIWRHIQKEIKPETSLIFRIKDMRSFYYGIAASFLFFFAAVGLYTTGKQIIYNSKPEEMKLNGAYQSAIKEFEKVVPAVVSNVSQTGDMKDYLNSKKEQLNYINAAITDIKNEMGSADLTPIKQIRLRQLYNAKLRVLQEIIDKGDMEL
jgi:hypothetical protein